MDLSSVRVERGLGRRGLVPRVARSARLGPRWGLVIAAAMTEGRSWRWKMELTGGARFAERDGEARWLAAAGPWEWAVSPSVAREKGRDRRWAGLESA